MADLTFRFGSTGADQLARDQRKIADTSVAASRGARILSDTLEKQRRAANVAAGASLALAKADDILKEAERELSGEADRVAENEREQARAALEAAAADKVAAAAAKERARQMKDLRKAATSGSLKGFAVALSPTLIPAAGVLAGAIGAIGVSFGAALTGAGLFAAMAKTAFTGAADDAKKLDKLQKQLATAEQARQRATTKTGKQAADQRIATIKAEIAQIKGQGAATQRIMGLTGNIKKQWTDMSRAVAAPVLVPWLSAVNAGIRHLRPLVQPVADLFKSWGETVDRYFRSKAGSAEIDRIATSLGKFSADQMSAIGVFVTDFVKGIANLGHLLGLHGTDFGAFSVYLDQWGGAFRRWSESDKARTAVNTFLDYVHRNGKTLTDILGDLAKIMPTLFTGLSGAGELELKAVSGFLGFVAGLPKGFQKPLVELAGALLLLKKTGVISVGIKLGGTLGPKLLKWLSGGLINIGGAATAAETIRLAMVSGGATAAESIRLAMVSGGATAAAAEGTAIGAAGTTAGTKAGGAFAIAMEAAGPAVAGILAGEIVKQIGDSLVKPGSTGAAAAAGFRQSGAPGATITGGFVGALAQALGIGGGGKAAAALKPLSQQLADIKTKFDLQAASAQYAMVSLNNYTGAVKTNGIQSTQAQGARQQLVTDLINSGVNSGKAQTDVGLYTQAVMNNGTNSDQARAARQRLIGDILSASGNARQGNTDMNTYTTAVQQHGVKSDQARSARLRLIQDLVNSGVDAHTATAYVDGLGGSVRKLPAGKQIDLVMVGKGTYVISERMTSKTNPFPGGISGRKAAGGLITMGSGPAADDVPILASRGEYVQRASAVSQYGVGAMNAVNAGRAVIAYAGGGPVTPPGFAAGGPVRGNLTPAFIEGMYTDFEHMMTNRFVQRMRASLAKAEATAAAGSGMSVLGYAMQYLHKVPYVWGGSTPAGWDCSGFVSWVLDHVRLFSGRTTAAGFQRWAKPSGPVPGGLAFYGFPAHHVGFVTDTGQLLSALGRAYGTTISALQMGDNAGYGIPPQGFGVPGGGAAGPGPGTSKLKELAFTLLSQYGWASQWPSFNALEMSEAGWDMNATNRSSKAYGLAQMYDPPGADLGRNKAKYFAYGGDPNTALGQLTAMMNYIAQRYGSPNAAWAYHQVHNSYAGGGLVPAMAAGGTVPRQGAAFLKAWQTRHGGGFGAAWGPVVLNEQIVRMAANQKASAVLAGSRLPAGQKRFWASAAADQAKRLAALKHELSVERSWRTQLGTSDVHLATWIKTAGGIPSLRGSVKSWKAQLARQKATIGAISKMLGYPAGWVATHPAQPKITHTYGGDVANAIAPVLARALAPFTGGVSMDRGGWLRPGWNPPMYNGLGRPEPVGAAAGGPVLVRLEVDGADQELVRLIRKMVKVKGGGNVQAAFGAR